MPLCKVIWTNFIQDNVFIVYCFYLGGLVSCRSVKLLEGQGPEEDDLRDSWWTEIRREIRSHARALSCNLIVGYTEDTVIS